MHNKIFRPDLAYRFALFTAQRFDAAIYIKPFMFLKHVIRSPTLIKANRMKLLSLTIQKFYFHLQHVGNCDKDDFFSPTFRSLTSIGTLFVSKIFLNRCINTYVVIAIATQNAFAFSPSLQMLLFYRTKLGQFQIFVF